MPSTYSSSLRLELQATGENANTWGVKTNNNLELIEQAIAGYVKITLTSASATYPLVIADASASDGRNAYIEFVGTVASAISITVPDVEKGYWVKNSATGSPLTFRTSSGTGVVLPTNQWVNLVSDGASITSTFPTSITGYALLSATQTFTGANTFTSVVNIQSNLSVTGNAFVSGVTTLASSVDIKGATSLASTLVANGIATFNSNVSVSGVMVVGAGAVGAPSYSTTGDTNTGIYFPAADTIAVATSGTERMRIDNAGNVGIATTSPSSFGKFAVQGASNTRAFYADALAQPVARYDDNSFVSNGLTIRNTGVAGSNQGIGLLFQLGAGGTAVDSGAIQMRSEADYSTAANQDAAMLFFAVANGTNSERMRITSGGLVGIGTSSPNSNAVLTNNGNIAIAAPTRNQATSNKVGVWTSDDPADNGRASMTIATVAGGSSSSSYISFETNNYGVDRAERMRIDSSGNVGIGTSSPGYKLDVAGVLAVGSTIFTGTGVSTGDVALELGQFRTGSGATYIDLHSVSGSDYEARFIRNGGANGNCALYNTGTGLFELTQQGAGDLYFGTNGSERMRIDSNGNVRVGAAALATTATNGFLYVPTCAGTPTGTPTAITGLAPIVINTTNNKLYFYSGGAWRDAGP